MKGPLEEPSVSGTAYGPADVRDTPHVDPSFHTEEAGDPEEEDPWIGRVLSNVYEIEAKIGEGGMGSVYLARHVHLEKYFAIKVLNEVIAGKSNAVERLKQEAMAAAKIDHESIVEVVNFDRTEEGAVFIVMEHLKGESLADAVARGPIELHRALPITYQICRALEAAHRHGIVHRDLKPENVFLTEKGGRTLVKILDFGISKVKRAEAEQVRMTKTGQLVGTPLYMSPEQARGEVDVDRRVDVYAMGVMLFEMLTGAPPFEGRNYFELLWKHGNEPPPSMSEMNPNVFLPAAVEEVVAKALAKSRDERFQTMAELEEALTQAAPEVPTLSPTPSLPPERASVPLSKEELGRAPTEALESSSALRPPPGETDELTIPARRVRWPLLAAAGLGILLIGAVGYVAFGGGDVEPPRPETPPEPTPREAPPPVAEEPPPEEPPQGVDPPPPSRLSLHLRSSPPGATVRIGDRELPGVTPLVTALDVSDDPVTLTFEKDGYLAQTITVVPVAGVEVPEVRLRRRRRASHGGGGGGISLPIKTGM